MLKKNPLPSKSALNFILDRFENEFAILKNESGEILRWPLHLIPRNYQPGDIIPIKILNEEEEQKYIYASQRKLLEELIN